MKKPHCEPLFRLLIFCELSAKGLDFFGKWCTIWYVCWHSHRKSAKTQQKPPARGKIQLKMRLSHSIGGNQL